jgi:uncharacterized membrane protein
MGDQVTRTIIVKADVNSVYQVWSNFENFPTFMENIESVTNTGPRTSHWAMSGPMGKTLEWDAETTLMEENSRIAWNSKDMDDNELTTSGMVTFTPLSQGETQITAIVQYEPKGGILGDVAEKLFGNPGEKLEEDLRNFKNYIEGRHDRTNQS